MTRVERSKVDFKALQKLYKEDAAARAVLDHLARRERNWTVSPVERLQFNVQNEGTSLSRGQVIDVLKRLEALGCGKFLLGRRGHPSRFEWSVGMVSVGRYAAGDADEVEALSEQDAGEEDGEMPQLKRHQYVLRHDLDPISIELPSNLTKAEASRLARFIETLPIE